MTDAQLLANAIAASGLTKRDFARDVVVRPERTVYRWLAGDPMPDAVRARLLAYRPPLPDGQERGDIAARAQLPIFCACGQPLHYSDPDLALMVQQLVNDVGPEVAIHVTRRRYMVSRHYIALHGLRATDLPGLTALGVVRETPFTPTRAERKAAAKAAAEGETSADDATSAGGVV